ncbi:MAG: hypothetical protein ABIZ82_01515 [Candidatus Tumulicola sp.]
MEKTARERYDEYCERFGSDSDEELVAAFNREIGNTGWVSARGAYLAALHDEFRKRGFDFSAIGDADSLSLRVKIRLKGKKIEPVDPTIKTGPAVLHVKPRE